MSWRSPLLLTSLLLFTFACGPDEEPTQTPPSMDMMTSMDQGGTPPGDMGNTPTSDIPAQDMARADQGTPDLPTGACPSPLMISKARGFIVPFEDLRIEVSGGSGEYSFEFVENNSEAILNEVSGDYLAGRLSGVTDIIRIEDQGCDQSIIFEVDVLPPMQVMPAEIELLPEQSFTYQVSQGSGSFMFTVDQNETGRVRVDGAVAVLGRRVDAETAQILVDGAPVGVRPGLVYYLLNKPVGVVTTADDPQGRPVVVGLVPDEPRVFPVGRLDLDTEGLLLLTNDGEIANRITHPSYGVEKEYVVHVEGSPTRSVLRQLREGVELDDGVTAPARVTPVEPNVLRLVIHEGRNRQVRRMCDAVGHPVIRLVRTRIGPLADRSIRPGTWRHLETDELRALERAVADGA